MTYRERRKNIIFGMGGGGRGVKCIFQTKIKTPVLVINEDILFLRI
jgi:hypothetical protein